MIGKFWKGIIIGLLVVFGQNTFAATTELGLGDTFKYSLISVGDILKVPEGATGCTIHDDSIPGTLDLDEQVGADTLGAELVTDGAFANWTGDDPNAPWVVVNEDANNKVTESPAGVANIVSNNTAAVNLYQNIAGLTDGELYKFTVEITINVAGWRFQIVGSDQYATVTQYTTAGLHTFYFTPDGTSIRLNWYRYAGVASDVEIDNVSVKKVTSDTGIYNTWITTVDLAGIGLEEVAIFRNCAFIESEATITATLPTATLEDETGATEMRGSFVDGQAWFHDAGGLIAAFADTGNLIIVNDGTGNLAQGYLGEVGTGETLGATLVPNGVDWTGAAGATQPTGWDYGGAFTAVNTIFDSADGAPYDKCWKLEINADPDANPWITESVATEVGKLYKFSFAFKHGTGSYGTVGIGTTAGASNYGIWGALGDAAWATYTLYFTALTTTTHFYVRTFSSTAGQYELFDEVSLQEVTEPAATAVHIYKEHALTNEGWDSITAGIDYNAGAAWDFDIYNYGTVYFDDECQFSITTADCFRDYAGADYHLTAGSPLKDAGEGYLNITNLDTSDFSAGVDNYIPSDLHTHTGDHDAISDGTTSKDNCLMLAANGDNAWHYNYIDKAYTGMSDQVNFKLTYSFYAPAAQTHVDGLRVQYFDGADTLLAEHISVSGVWTTNTIYFSAAETAIMRITFLMTDGGVRQFVGDNDGTGDLLYLHNVIIGYDAGDVDLEGRITPIGAGYDIGAYELRLSGGSMGMGMGLRGYSPHRPED